MMWLLWVLLGFIILIPAIYFFPIRYTAVYNDKGAYAWLWLGFIRIQAYPEKPEKKEMKRDKRFDKEKLAETPGVFEEFATLMKELFEFLAVFSDRFTVKRLNVKIVMGGGDPAELALNYGRAWAAVGNLYPQLERFFNIKKRNIQVECDFNAEQSKIYADAEIVIPLGKVFTVYDKYTKVKEKVV